LSPARTVTVWLAIDDADEANSAMRFIPGTHDKGVIATSAMGADSVFHKGIADAESHGKPFTNALKAGQVSLHADMLVHGSLANRSDRRRCGLTLRYCPTEVRFTDRDWARGSRASSAAAQTRPDNGSITPGPKTTTSSRTSSPHVVGNN
jgi:non-heme Fe2+,alpha-ketoglutarate-dependent halogenase